MPISKLKASSIASGTIDNARISLDANEIPALPTSKITSGTFDDARIAASNVSQHATSFDDNKLVNDLSTLGLRVHTQENLSASNTNSQYIDVFQDSSGLTNLTNCTRQSDEYIASVYTSTTNISDGINGGDNQDPSQTASGSSSYTGYDGVTRSNGQIGDNGSYNSYNIGHLFDATDDFECIVSMRGTYQGTGYLYGNDMSALSAIGTHANGGYTGTEGAAWSTLSQGTHQGQYHSPVSGDGSGDYRNLYRWSRESNSFKLQYYGRSTSDITVDATSIAAVRASTNYVDNIGGVQTRNEKMLLLVGEAGSISYIRIEVLNKSSGVASATGSFENNAITAPSSVSSMGAVITYQDNAGTNALNTDIVLQLSADGGSNYSTATLTALPDFSTGIKMAKVNDLAVTSGTSLKYKILFANQASGSKEARIRGVSLNY